MPLSQWNLEWLNHNAQRNYPLADHATCMDVTESFTLPTDFLLELDLPIHAAMDVQAGKFFIRLIGVYPTGYSITVSYDGLEGYVDVATALVSAAAHKRNTQYALGGIEPFTDTVGKLVIGRLETISTQPTGLWVFSPQATPIEPDCIRPILRGVQALYVVEGNQRSMPITGDVELEAGNNIQIIPIIGSGNPKIIFNAISGEGLTQECVCEGEEDAPCIRWINGVGPTLDGKFYLVGDKCLQITNIEHGLRIEDKCCQPCCGCEELEAITRDLERYAQERATLENFVKKLEASVKTMEMVVLGSRLGDRGCVTCE